MNKILLFFISILVFFVFNIKTNAQEIVKPTKVTQAIFHDKIESFKNLPTGRLEREEIIRNAKLKERIFPNKGNVPILKEDPVWQKNHPSNKSQTKAPLLNFNGQNTNSMPSDCNGEVGQIIFFKALIQL
ncbi:MAG: hypothetical protein JXA16_09255 [Bacteroidales bacterium]|nr:hypothetical protein [Bacteroidales bacterium]